ncbi:MAG: hypothetical protein ACI84R_004165, partial [Candidatus Azotimanducaceae bacterium]
GTQFGSGFLVRTSDIRSIFISPSSVLRQLSSAYPQNYPHNLKMRWLLDG